MWHVTCLPTPSTLSLHHLLLRLWFLPRRGYVFILSFIIVHSWARNLFDEHFTFSDQISSLLICYYQLSCVWHYLDSKNAFSIATFIVHRKFDHCNFVYYNLLKSQLIRVQQILNFLARTVVKAPKSCHISRIVRSLYWLWKTEHIEVYIIFSAFELIINIPHIICLCFVSTN